MVINDCPETASRSGSITTTGTGNGIVWSALHLPRLIIHMYCQLLNCMVKTCGMGTKHSLLGMLLTTQLLLLCKRQLVITETTATATTCRPRPSKLSDAE